MTVESSPISESDFLEFAKDRYIPEIHQRRSAYFPQLLNAEDAITYLDSTASLPIPAPILTAHHKDLMSSLYSNPHSRSPSSKRTTKAIHRVRKRILEHFNTDEEEYTVIFTSNATAGIQLVTRGFPWKKESNFWYHQASHTSILGIRAHVDQVVGLEAHHVKMMTSEDIQSYLKEQECNDSNSNSELSLFAYPAQCNFSGKRYPLDWCTSFQEGSTPWKVLLDAASYCSTTPLDLSDIQPDFVILSFYKLFGFPTALGAVLVRNDTLQTMSKTYFGGGTVASVAADIPYHVFKEEEPSAKWEDGTLPFTEILALEHGFDYIENTFGSWNALHDHVMCLAQYTREKMASLVHQTPASPPVCVIYPSDKDSSVNADLDLEESLGSIISFNLKRADGSWIGYAQVAKLAKLFQIHLRVGCFCNPGACQMYLGIDGGTVQTNARQHGHVCGGHVDLINGKPTGAIRISFGFHSTFEDVRRWFQFLEDVFVERQDLAIEVDQASHHFPLLRVSALYIYPIKSCRGLQVDSWNLTSAGLELDRRFVLKDKQGKPLTLLRCPQMTKVRPVSVDMATQTLVMSSPNMKDDLVISFQQRNHRSSKNDHPEQDGLENKDLVCYNRNAPGVDDTLQSRSQSFQIYNAWFSKALGQPVQLFELAPTSSIKSYSNASPFLLVSETSFNALKDKTDQDETLSLPKDYTYSLDNFRANIVIQVDEKDIGTRQFAPFEEEDWVKRKLCIGDHTFFVAEKCPRCNMIGIDSLTGVRMTQPLKSLAKHHVHKGTTNFGIYMILLSRPEEHQRIQVGDSLSLQF